jgi:hypothetical protein
VTTRACCDSPDIKEVLSWPSFNPRIIGTPRLWALFGVDLSARALGLGLLSMHICLLWSWIPCIYSLLILTIENPVKHQCMPINRAQKLPHDQIINFRPICLLTRNHKPSEAIRISANINSRTMSPIVFLCLPSNPLMDKVNSGRQAC